MHRNVVSCNNNSISYVTSVSSCTRCHGEGRKYSGFIPEKPVCDRGQVLSNRRHFGSSSSQGRKLSRDVMTEWNPDNPADLGIWDDLGWTQPPPKKKAKRLKLKKKDTEHHFAETDGDNSRFLSPSKGLESYQEPYCPKNTAVSTRWALKNFSDWTSS